MSVLVDEGSGTLMGCYIANGRRGERERERERKRVLATHAIRRASIHSMMRGHEKNKHIYASLTCTEFQPIKENDKYTIEFRPRATKSTYIYLHMRESRKKK
jgi:hypothetical protein